MHLVCFIYKKSIFFLTVAYFDGHAVWHLIFQFLNI